MLRGAGSASPSPLLLGRWISVSVVFRLRLSLSSWTIRLALVHTLFHPASPMCASACCVYHRSCLVCISRVFLILGARAPSGFWHLVSLQPSPGSPRYLALVASLRGAGREWVSVYFFLTVGAGGSMCPPPASMAVGLCFGAGPVTSDRCLTTGF